MTFGEKFLKRKSKQKLTPVEQQVSANVVKDALVQYFTPLNVFKPAVQEIDIVGYNEILDTYTLHIYYENIKKGAV